MTSLRNNHKDAVSLMIGEYRRLQDHNLNHDLLKYVCDFSDDDFQYSPDEKIRQAREESERHVAELEERFFGKGRKPKSKDKRTPRPDKE